MGEYYMPMDREYSSAADHSHHHSHGSATTKAQKTTGDLGLSIGDLGWSMGLGPVPNIQSIASKMRAGGKKLEFVFMGQSKGSAQGHTPGMYGLKQRQALVEMGRANKIDFTTHSTVGVYGLAGQTQQGGFARESKQQSLDEVKRAIEFAAEVGKGGPIVVHTGEFERPIVDAKWNQQKDDPYKEKFQRHSQEKGTTSYRVVDTRTGNLIAEAKKNRAVPRPVWLRADKDYTDEGGQKVNKGDFVDYFDNKVTQLQDRVPVLKDDGTPKIKNWEWEDLEGEAKEMTIRAREEWRKNKDKDKKWWKEKAKYPQFREFEREEDIKVRPEEAYIIATLETQAANARGYALYYGGNINESVEKIKKIRKAKEFYEKLEKTTDPEEKWRLEKQVPLIAHDLIPPDTKFPSELLDKALKEEERHLKHFQETSTSQWSQVQDATEQIRHVRSAETYAIDEAADSYAQAAISAMRHSENLKQKGELKKELFVALENLFPEHYGSHPDELMHLVEKSRQKMVQKLMENKVSREEAEQKATAHINTTFDTGHLNMWRKYWQGDPNKTMAQNDAEFDKWALAKVDEMLKKKMIGHVHIDDNYGYHDDHLAPGEGNTPVREMMKILKKHNYKGELIVEPGADYNTDLGGWHSVMKTWKHFDLPVYGAAGAAGVGSWGGVQYGWPGRNQPAYFTVGAYVPSEDWSLWSGVSLE